jgi:acetyl-CoA/propionyl-CoA carboxylase biotin carboxyl carrier protein
MGSKTKARELMKAAGVPIVPGTTDPVKNVAAAKKIIDKDIGYPIAVKAAGGGGGKGFRVAESEDELEKAFEGASREGDKFFSDPTVYIERYLPDPRHVEVQVLADSHGNVVHLFERDCSVQRRHQKLIEESPAPAVDPELRERIGKIGTEAAKAVNYRSAGTIEGLLQDGEYFFLEMNTRVQVEHCVTEMVTGIDIVREQVKIAAGEELAFGQDDIEIRGHSIECRINAEDASKKFAPAPGKIGSYREPSGPGVRVDSGAEEGYEVLPLYDPMIAKLIVWDVDREASTRRMIRALHEYEIGGLKTLIPFHQTLLATEQWKNGETCRDLVEDKDWLKQLAFDPPPADDGDDEEPKVARDYAVEVSGKRFEVKVIGAALPNGGAPAAGAAKKAPKRRDRGAGGGGGGRDRLADPGHRAEGGRREGRHRRGGRADLRRRGDEDGERDHRAERRHGRGAERVRGRRDRHRGHHRRRQIALAGSSSSSSRALLHLMGRDVLDVRGDVPHVTERILEASGAVTVELVLQGLPLGGARVERLLEHAVDILDVDV